MLKALAQLMTAWDKPTQSTKVPVLTCDLVQFRRTTNRYGKLGTFSSNRGYVMAVRDLTTGQFTKG
jgi:hypothetical protein